MKRFLITSLAFFVVLVVNAQKGIEGIWEGKLALGATSLRLVVNIKKDSTGYSATFDSPDQGAKGIKTDGVVVRGDSLFVEVPSVGGRISGKLSNDSIINGAWFQGASLPLLLKKVAAASEFKRPQTPKPPYAYLSEDVIYHNRNKSVQYGATLTTPKGTGPFPAIILITGSGQQNRDEELFGHKPFAVLADYLTKKGYAVLRVDDRGVGQTTGDAKAATSKDFATDVNAGIDYLKGRKEVDKTKLGLLGHSEGGMIAQLVAAERTDIAYLISMAGPGQKITDLMVDQNRAVLQSSGLSKQAIDDYLKFYSAIIPLVINAPTDTAAKVAGFQLLNKWVTETPVQTVAATTGIKDSASKINFINSFAGQLRTPWFKYFMSYNPEPYIQKIRSKVLVINGEKDVQVAAKPNIAGWKASLLKSRSKKFDVIELKGLNHLFQHCIACTVQEYGVIEETIAPEALNTIGDWLKKNVK